MCCTEQGAEAANAFLRKSPVLFAVHWLRSRTYSVLLPFTSFPVGKKLLRVVSWVARELASWGRLGFWLVLGGKSGVLLYAALRGKKAGNPWSWTLLEVWRGHRSVIMWKDRLLLCGSSVTSCSWRCVQTTPKKKYFVVARYMRERCDCLVMTQRSFSYFVPTLTGCHNQKWPYRENAHTALATSLYNKLNHALLQKRAIAC